MGSKGNQDNGKHHTFPKQKYKKTIEIKTTDGGKGLIFKAFCILCVIFRLFKECGFYEMDFY
jgi:hypothetical protein